MAGVRRRAARLLYQHLILLLADNASGHGDRSHTDHGTPAHHTDSQLVRGGGACSTPLKLPPTCSHRVHPGAAVSRRGCERTCRLVPECDGGAPASSTRPPFAHTATAPSAARCGGARRLRVLRRPYGAGRRRDARPRCDNANSATRLCRCVGSDSSACRS